MSHRRFGRTQGGLSSLGLRVVWCRKYRRRVLAGRVARRLGELLERIAVEHGWQIVEVMADHVHLLVRAFKGRTARLARQEFPHLGNYARSEERRVGKECLRLCRSRWSPYH